MHTWEERVEETVTQNLRSGWNGVPHLSFSVVLQTLEKSTPMSLRPLYVTWSTK